MPQPERDPPDEGTTDIPTEPERGAGEADDVDGAGFERDGVGAGERRRKLGDAIVSGILESGAAFRRGQDLLGGVASGTKEEIVRIVGAEVRGFLDKMDVVDLAQEVVSGLVVEIKTEVRFRRDAEGKLKPEFDESKTDVKTDVKTADED